MTSEPKKLHTTKNNLCSKHDLATLTKAISESAGF